MGGGAWRFLIGGVIRLVNPIKLLVSVGSIFSCLLSSVLSVRRGVKSTAGAD